MFRCPGGDMFRRRTFIGTGIKIEPLTRWPFSSQANHSAGTAAGFADARVVFLSVAAADHAPSRSTSCFPSGD